jgi:hypothetical protein
MKTNFDNNTDNIYSLHNLDNYNKSLTNNSHDIIKKYCEIMNIFFKIIVENLKVKKNEYSKFIIIRGFETITNVFNNILYYTKNLDLTYYHCQKSSYYYVEFIQQITEEQHVFLQLSSRDASTYVYKKNIFEINHDITKNIPHANKELKNKLDVINKHTSIFKYLLETVLLNSDLENECSEKKVELINKLEIIYEHIHLLKLDDKTIQIIQKCFELINEINSKNENTEKSNEIYLDTIFTLLKKCGKNTHKIISTIEKNILVIDLEEVTINNIITFITK